MGPVIASYSYRSDSSVRLLLYYIVLFQCLSLICIACPLTFTTAVILYAYYFCNGLTLCHFCFWKYSYILYITCPANIVSNPHLEGLASLHTAQGWGGGGSPQVAEIHYKKKFSLWCSTQALSHLFVIAFAKIGFEVDIKFSFFASNQRNILEINRKSLSQRVETKFFVSAIIEERRTL
jgi:hypothetical protein